MKRTQAGWRSLLLGVAMAGWAGFATAAPVAYEGSLLAGTPVTGQVGATGAGPAQNTHARCRGGRQIGPAPIAAEYIKKSTIVWTMVD